ncbi:MAG: TIGR02099 family protein, partial [Arenimonas sp.]|nr:TIGR02099 family protein [Arenimonas sp.]
ESRNQERLVSDIRVHAGQGRWQAKAAAVDVSALAALNPALIRQLPKVHAWLRNADLSGRFSRLKAHGDVGRNAWTISGKAEGLGMAAVGKSPGFQDVSGVFMADQSGGTFKFKPSDPLLVWPVSFGRNIPGKIDGAVLWWKSSADWLVAAKDLHWQGDGIQADVDMKLQFHQDGRKPMLNVAARLAPFGFDTAKRFWLRHMMPPNSIRWLDMALEKGQIRDASIVIAGDLGHWPFSDKTGRFSARATILAESFKFASDWPAAERAVLQADFNGPGFSVTGEAMYLGNRLTLKPSGMQRFSETELVIDVASETSMQALMPVVNDTPLKQKLGEAVYSLQGEGPARVGVNLFLPLKAGPAYNTVNGTVDFKDVAIRAPLWNLAMKNAKGQAVFSHSGFIAKELSGLIDGNPAKLDIRVGRNYTQNRTNHVEAVVRGVFSTEYLLSFDPSLKDLKKALQGTSPWQFTISSPAAGNQGTAPVYLRAQSDLVGTRVNLPEPLQKPAATAQALSMLTQLPVDKGSVEFKLGNQFRLLLKKPLNKPMSGIALFGEQTQGAIPASGFSVRGQTERFDVASWLALAKKAEDGAGLQDFDLTVARLRLMGSEFGSTRLLISPMANGMKIHAQGDRLDGQVSILDAKNTAINAVFKTVHLAATGVKTLETATVSANAPIDFGNPAELPPILLSIQDLRIGDAGFGRCELRTVPGGQGLLIQKFSTRSPLLTLDATGLWQGVGKDARTSVQANLASKDLGLMLTAFHYQDVIKSGATKAQFTGAWNGSPMDFSLQGFNGNLSLDVSQGQILGVEPGGGRVLGLVSLAEIPRRLSLDFSDFFGKGFSFNQITGQFSFAQGKANTQNLKILAPAANITITGSTDLVKQQFDQRVEVRAKTSGLLPVLGAVTLGPVGIAAGVVAQAVLDKPLKDNATVHYEITGPWAKPDVRKVKVPEK